MTIRLAVEDPTMTPKADLDGEVFSDIAEAMEAFDAYEGVRFFCHKCDEIYSLDECDGIECPTCGTPLAIS